ncbi:MAG TPA: GNVR domain-containing protein [Nitrospirota bacterium]|nr:GNVR domain-containing protein [Nitrospirota bacterium]
MEKPSEPDVVRIIRGGMTARERPQEFDIKKYLRLIYKRRYAFVAVMMLVTGIILGVGYLLPNKYEATSIVLVEGGYANNVMKDVAAPASVDPRVKAVEVIMQSSPHVLKVLKELGYDLGQYSQGEVEQLVGSFQHATKIIIDPDSSRRGADVFTVSLKHKSPSIARDYVNALVRLYIEESQSSKRNETVGAKKFLVEQVEILRQKISAIDADIASIHQMREARTSVMKPVKVDTVQNRLVELRKQLRDLLLRYTPTHPEVVKIQDEIASLEGQVDGSEQAHGTAADSGKLLNTPSSDDAADPAASIERGGKAVSRNLARREQKLKELERDRDTYQKMYEEMLATLGKSEVSSNLEVQDKGLTFNVIEPAVLPLRPVSPNRVLIILLGFFAGIVAAIGSVIMLDSMDKSVKSIETAKTFGHPVLAIFPNIQLPREKNRTQMMNVLLFAITMLYVAGIGVLLVVVSTQ